MFPHSVDEHVCGCGYGYGYACPTHTFIKALSQLPPTERI